MDAFQWWSIAGIGRMIDVTDIGTEIGEERIVRRNGMRKKIVKIRKIVHRKFFSMQMRDFIIARFFFSILRKRLKILLFVERELIINISII